MNATTQTQALVRTTAWLMIPVMINGCAAYRLSDKNPQYPLTKVHRATHGVCAVAPFDYRPSDAGDADLMSRADLELWNRQFFQAINRADVCGRTLRVASASAVPAQADYLIDGTVTDFYFKKNWVPMFFPGWMGLTFFTLGIYGIAAGPTTSTMVDFAYTVNLKDAKTGKLIASIPEQFESKDVMTMYSDDNHNPYGNPGLAIGPTINDAMVKLAEAISRVDPASDDALESLRKLRDQGVLSEQEYSQKLDRLLR